MLELQDIAKQWRGFSLDAIDLRVEAGEYFVLLGPSGAGKSLLLELVAGFHAPDRGRVVLDGRDVTDLPPERRHVGFVYQDNMLFPHQTAGENIGYGLRIRGTAREDAHRTVERLAGMLHIERLLHRRPDELSGGEKQRVSLARALAVEPLLLLMDEPLAALDPAIQQALRAELARVHCETGVTVVHVTHDQAEAQQLGERIGVMRDGRLVQVGKAEQVFERPQNGFVAGFTGACNILDGRAAADGSVTRFSCGPVELVSTARIDGPARAVIRPENIFISTEPVRTSARNQLTGLVVSVEKTGRTFAVEAEFDGLRLTSLVTQQSLQELEIRVGARVYFSFKASSLHLMEPEEERDDRV